MDKTRFVAVQTENLFFFSIKSNIKKHEQEETKRAKKLIENNEQLTVYINDEKKLIFINIFFLFCFEIGRSSSN